MVTLAQTGSRARGVSKGKQHASGKCCEVQGSPLCLQGIEN